jgi:hypothetical protein
MMHTELYCTTLPKLDIHDAARAMHEAYLQLASIGTQVEVGGVTYDNAPALNALRACLQQAGHTGFTQENLK